MLPWTLIWLAQTVDFPCVPDFRADRGMIQVSEASGGQVLLFRPTELGHPAIAEAYNRARDPTILRASGTLGAGTVEFAAPVDASVTRLTVSVFAECVKVASVLRPSGTEVAGEKFKSGRIVMLDSPAAGLWRVRLAGTGYYSVIVQGRTPLRLHSARIDGKRAAVSLDGPMDTLLILSRAGAVLATAPLDGAVAAPAEPYRLGVRSGDVQRVLPELITPQ